MFSKFTVFQVNADPVHNDVGNDAEAHSGNGNDQDGQEHEIHVAFIVEISPPGHNAFESAGIRNDDNGRSFCTCRQANARSV